LSAALEPLKSYEPKTFRYETFDIETNAPTNDKVWAVGYTTESGQYGKFSVEDSSTQSSIAYEPHRVGGPIDLYMRYILRGYGTHTIYSHNGGNFDLQFIARWLVEFATEFGLTVEIIPLSSSIMILDVKRGSDKWRFLDSGRIFTNGSTALSLDSVAETFKLPNKQIPPEIKDDPIKKSEWYANLFRNPERWDYLRTDVAILHEALHKFVSELRKIGGDISVSGASTAMRTFRMSFQSLDICIARHFDNCELTEGPLDGQCVGCLHDVFRAAYYGGRVESFFVAPFESGTDVFYGDVNSMYPFAMLKPMPIGEFERDDTRHKAKWENEVGFVDATVTIPDTYLPPLPWRYRNKLIFPYGTFRGTWEASELAQIQRIGGTVQSVHCAVWTEAREIFASYVRELYKLRDKSRADYEPGRAGIAKILLNSLYGKFGSNFDRERIWISPTVEDIQDKQLRDMCDEYKNLFVEDVFVYPEYLIPQIAARVTALARSQLWGLMQDALASGAKLFYCDTDSIVSTHQFKWGNELGQIKLEKTARKGHFAAPKLYRFGDTESSEYLKAKGFSGGFGAKLNHNDWERIIDGAEMRSQRMGKLKTWARSGSVPSVHTAIKKRTGQYDKRAILPTGETRPWIVINGELR
jgi:hypothetical protein